MEDMVRTVEDHRKREKTRYYTAVVLVSDYGVMTGATLMQPSSMQPYAG